jgi:predicted helicase
MKHMLEGENLGLITTRVSTEGWDCFITENLCGHKSCAAYDINSLFPLYLYTTPDQTAGTLFLQAETTRRANLEPAFVQALSEKLGLKFVPDGRGDLNTTYGPEDVFDYAYAMFHSHAFRQRYAEFLKIDFPRLPLTSNKELFFTLARLGMELVELHLLKSPKVEEFITSYPIPGNNLVEKVQFIPDPKTSGRLEGFLGHVSINSTQYIGDVPEDVWNFKIGGYQVCEKWLKDRKGRTLSGEDISHYQRVVVALNETIRLMGEIDEAIPGWPIV